MAAIGKIGFLGGGNMAKALAKGFIAAGLTKPSGVIASVHPADKISQQSFQGLGIETLVENAPVVEQSKIVFISVKPQVVPQVLSEIKDLSANKLFLSVAMGITLKTLESSLSADSRVIRVMPNTPALVCSGCSVFVRGKLANDADAQITKRLLEAVGTCEQVDESQLDIVTALSGSGPAYVFVMIEALADGAVRMGMPRDMAYRLAAQTVLGSGHMVRECNTHPGQLKDNVTSPAGSTAAALKHLEQSGFRAAVAGAVEAATLRCREISSKPT
ncbi:LOW QUALITY PROTEIN: pyrroline-5-carboxylate reductase 3 [Drosophila nasuta]|uniref:Pyrroline-5-carboxylate reductase n=1 Tax=Drosophila albomicans TaxID=7291 RepID=A0A6P8XQ35_DROAB|nr:pyrroline-5-carboxylate reductase 3 [Drosophila albomicans]XP_060650644.1 LOW QUALITY PROTEIN: pyrroline-5-carboxylate reductase 3 [Drosophila nasuta]